MKLPLDSVKMEPCYTKVTLLPERLLDLQSRFRFPHVDLVVQGTQNYMQEVGAESREGEAEEEAEARKEGRERARRINACWWVCPRCSSAQESEAGVRLTEDTHCSSSWLYLALENKSLGR